MPIDPQEILQVRAQLADAQAERDRMVAAAAARNAELDRVDADIRSLTAAGNLAGAAARQAERDRLQGQRSQGAAQLHAFDDELRRIVGQLAVDSCDADPAYPLLLLPVRVETRFTRDGAGLRVRIFPDEIHLDRLDRGLSDVEQAAGRAFWTAAWRADDAAAGAAWRTLGEQVGRRRALWTAIALTPTNLGARMADAGPAFPEVGPRTENPAVARLLPDCFTAVAVQGDQESRRTGNPIAPAVRVAIFANDGAELTTVNGVRLAVGTEWLADYAEAERIGMAVTVPLARPGRAVDQLFVFGACRAIDPATLPGELEALLQSHRCTTGLAFAPQGTPTNNTEATRPTRWQRTEIPAPSRDPVAAPQPGSNAATLGAALGLSPEALAPIAHAADLEQPLARAMNLALWEPTWGEFLEKANTVTEQGATLSDAVVEQARRFHRDFVRGRGPLPVLRVGNQPYGVLPVSSLGPRWRPADDFESRLLDILRPLRDRWRGCLPAVPRVGEGAIDETLQELLGMSPVATSLRVRQVLSYELGSTGAQATGLADDAEIGRIIDQLVWEIVHLASQMRPTGRLAEDSRPLALPMVDENADAAAIERLLAGDSSHLTSLLQALLAIAWSRANEAVERAGARGRLAEIVQSAAILSGEQKERVLAIAGRGRSDAATLFAESERVAHAAGIAGAPTLNEYQPVSSMRSSFGELALASANGDSRATLSVFGTIGWLNASGRLAELREALALLAGELAPPLENGKSRLAFAEALDLASHRLDAWLTAVVERRRQSARAGQPTGLVIGAYGWLEHIVPARNGRGDGGYVHAPSLTHAATAGILRSAYLSHNDSGDGSGGFGIDLTSARVRTAMQLVDGIRQGQQLGALLGYRIERRLHEHRLDRLLLTLRSIAPLRQGKLTDRGATHRLEAIEALAPTNVVDGVQLVEMYQGKVNGWTADGIRGKLASKPENNPYLTGDWPPFTAADWDHVRQAIEEAAAACDAVADLLMAESVHQIVQGNVARSAAALDAAGTGDVPPAEPDVVRSPLVGVPLTHRLLLVAAGGEPWSRSRPRAKAEPRLEAWCAARLGHSQEIIVGTDGAGGQVTLADAELAALDIVYDASDRRVFEQRIRAALPALAPDAPLAETRDAAWPASRRAIGEVFELATAIRAVLASARPATGPDLAVPNADNTRDVDADDLKAVQRRVQDASDALAVRAHGLEGLLAAAAPDEAAIRQSLEALAGYGIALPPVAGSSLVAVAEATLAEANRRVTIADAALTPPSQPNGSVTAEATIAAGQAIFGDGFWTAPAIAGPTGSDAWQAALSDGSVSAPPSEIRRYLADAAFVRDGVRRYADLLLLAEAIGSPPELRVAQVAGVGDVTPSRWIGGRLPDNEPSPDLPVASAVLDATGDYDGAGATLALVVDQWVDVLQAREKRGSDDGAPVDERMTTGISFNAAAASARAPQALLLAVSPDGARWTSDAVLDVLRDTLDLAKLRGVTLERTDGVAAVLPAIYQRNWSLQGEPVLDLRFVAERIRDTTALAAYVKEAHA